MKKKYKLKTQGNTKKINEPSWADVSTWLTSTSVVKMGGSSGAAVVGLDVLVLLGVVPEAVPEAFSSVFVELDGAAVFGGSVSVELDGISVSGELSGVGSRSSQTVSCSALQGWTVLCWALHTLHWWHALHLLLYSWKKPGSQDVHL